MRFFAFFDFLSLLFLAECVFPKKHRFYFNFFGKYHISTPKSVTGGKIRLYSTGVCALVSNGTLGLQSFPTRRHPSSSRMIGSPMHTTRIAGAPCRDLPIFIFFNVRVFFNAWLIFSRDRNVRSI